LSASVAQLSVATSISERICSQASRFPGPSRVPTLENGRKGIIG